MTRSIQRILSTCKEHTIKFNKHANSDETNDLESTRSSTFRKVVNYTKWKLVKRDRERRIDFVSQLPNEIVIMTLIPMLMEDYRLDSSVPFPFLQVCKEWRARILQYSSGLPFTIPIEEEENVNKCSQLVQLAQYATSLNILWYKDWVDDLLLHNDLCSVRELMIQDFRCTNKEHFLSSLRPMSNTLIRIFLRYNSLPLGDLLSVCPNLTCLDMAGPQPGTLWSLPSTPYPTLTTFIIRNATRRIAHDQVIAICKHFPSLKKLSLSPCSSIQSALVVSDYYPSMTQLTLVISHDSFMFTYLDQGHAYQQDGLTSLKVVAVSHQRERYRYIRALFNKFHQTLVELDYKFESSTHDMDAIQFPRLKKLVLSRCGWWILRNASTLEELQISSRAIENHPSVLNTVPQGLQTLKLRLFPTGDFHDVGLIEKYIRSVAQKSRLKQLVIHAHSLEELDMVYYAIGYLNHLECLMISYQDRNTNQLEQFIDRLADGCPKLKCLKMRYKDAPSVYAILALKRLYDLQHLACPVQGMEHNTPFWDAIQSLSQLKCIELYPATSVNNDSLVYLRDKRPDLKIIVHSGYIQFLG
ncbi:hypothetical protein K492DRAFT_211800 [Lichtheimia hyalospora FSU 10163]|nr:hypothetical protein K492DRAFT_211800 [Lichtheimia hyalospora FSU 10163]